MAMLPGPENREPRDHRMIVGPYPTATGPCLALQTVQRTTHTPVLSTSETWPDYPRFRLKTRVKTVDNRLRLLLCCPWKRSHTIKAIASWQSPVKSRTPLRISSRSMTGAGKTAQCRGSVRALSHRRERPWRRQSGPRRGTSTRSQASSFEAPHAHAVSWLTAVRKTSPP